MQHGRSISSVNGSISTILSLAEINICTRCTLVRSSRVFSLCTLPLHVTGVRMTNADGSSMLLGPLDAPVVSFGPQYAYPIPTNSTANPAYGVSSVLWDNLWGALKPCRLQMTTSLTLIGTNYVMWWPYNNDGQAVAGEQSILFRYTLAFD